MNTGLAGLGAWARSTGLVTTEAGEAHLEAIGLCRWASYVLPGCGAREQALMAQWAAFVCLVDDAFDAHPSAQRHDAAGTLMPTLLGVLETARPPTAHASPAVKALADLWRRTGQAASGAWRERFIARYTEFAEASVEEAQVRESGTLLDLPAYLGIRHRSITMLPLVEVSEQLCGSTLTDFWRGHEGVHRLRQAAVAAVACGNDIASAEAEHALGQQNIISVIARIERCDRATAYDKAVAHLREQLRACRVAKAELDTQPGAASYATLLGNWVYGSLRWQCETRRFGPTPNKAHLIRRLLKESETTWLEAPA
ncbi:terpene synthase family protein [Streptomyces sp. NPDC058412]|uniref:terpene synthase family protein n=1 Tax=Streptomyces sp. NPDC058412 TaxID=3346486 RepID=UPI00364A3622